VDERPSDIGNGWHGRKKVITNVEIRSCEAGINVDQATG
jgi:hypothetical protein